MTHHRVTSSHGFFSQYLNRNACAEVSRKKKEQLVYKAADISHTVWKSISSSRSGGGGTVISFVLWFAFPKCRPG